MKNASPQGDDMLIHTISIQLRYFGDDTRLKRLHGREIHNVLASQTTIDHELQRLAGASVLILEVDGDEDTVIYTLGDPPKVDLVIAEAATDESRRRARQRDVEVALLDHEPVAPVEATVFDDEIPFERDPKIVARRIRNTG